MVDAEIEVELGASDGGFSADEDTQETGAGTSTRGQKRKVDLEKKNANKHGGKGKKKQKKCWCCRVPRGADDFSVVANLCHNGKRAYDNLYYIAKKQQQLPFVKEAFKDEDKVFKLLQKYWDKNPRLREDVYQKNKKGKRDTYSKFCLATYIEESKASSGVVNDSVGVMMWREQFVAFAASPDGGLRTRPVALEAWANMQKDTNVVRDAKGPGPSEDDKLRLCVVKEDRVIFRNSWMQSKKTELREASVRKPDQAQIDTMEKRILQNHARVGAAGESIDMIRMAQHMVSHSGGEAGAFGGREIEVGNVQAFLESSDDESGSAAEEADDAASAVGTCSAKGSAGGSFTTATPRKKGGQPPKNGEEDPAEKWFDFEKTSMGLKRTEQNAIKRMTQTLTDLSTKCQETIDLAMALGEEKQASVRSELSLLVARKRWLDTILGNDASALDECIKQAQKRGAVPGNVSEGRAADAMAMRSSTLAIAPPTQSFDKLMLVSALERRCAEFEVFQSQQALMKLQSSLSDLRKPMADLRTNVNSALTELKRALREATSSGPKAKGKCKAAAGARPKANLPSCVGLFEVAPDLSKEIMSSGGKGFDLAKFKPDEPYLMKIDDDAQAALMKDGPVKTGLDDFKRLFSKCKQRESEGRAVQKWPEGSEGGEVVKSALIGLVPAQHCMAISDVDSALWPLLGWSNFGIVADTTIAVHERDYMATLRMTYMGTRAVIMTSAGGVASFMEKKGMGGAFSGKRLSTFFKNLSADGLQEYVQAGNVIWTTTVAPADVLYTPACFVVVERTTVSHDIIGLKAGVLVVDATALKALEGLAESESMNAKVLLREMTTHVGNPLQHLAAGEVAALAAAAGDAANRAEKDDESKSPGGGGGDGSGDGRSDDVGDGKSDGKGGKHGEDGIGGVGKGDGKGKSQGS